MPRPHSGGSRDLEQTVLTQAFIVQQRSGETDQCIVSLGNNLKCVKEKQSDSLPRSPAQAAARNLPGRRERKVGRGVQFIMGLFGKTQEKPPKELVNEWSLKIRKEMRVVDRQIRDIQREEEKVKRSVKDAAKKGQKEVCVVLAKEMIRSRKAVSKLYASKAHMNPVLMGMKNQLAVLRVAGSLQKSTEVMKAMQSLVKIPEIQATMRELSKEMMKAGILEEMLEDTFESMDGQEEVEEAAETEIDRSLFEITAGALGKASSKVTDALPEPDSAGAMAASEEGEEEEDEEDLEAMQSQAGHTQKLGPPSWGLSSLVSSSRCVHGL